jgi:hypothetical protein
VKLTIHLPLVPRSRMRGAIPALPQYVFMMSCLVKHRDNFTFTRWEDNIKTNVLFMNLNFRCSEIIKMFTEEGYGSDAGYYEISLSQLLLQYVC